MFSQAGKLLIFVVLIVGAAFVFVRLSNQDQGWARGGEKVQVFYPAGDCQTGKIQIERFDRETSRWLPHPEHPLVAAGRCYWEDSGSLFNELRTRCVELENGSVSEASDWVVGADVDIPVDQSVCREDG